MHILQSSMPTTTDSSKSVFCPAGHGERVWALKTVFINENFAFEVDVVVRPGKTVWLCLLTKDSKSSAQLPLEAIEMCYFIQRFWHWYTHAHPAIIHAHYHWQLTASLSSQPGQMEIVWALKLPSSLKVLLLKWMLVLHLGRDRLAVPIDKRTANLVYNFCWLQ